MNILNNCIRKNIYNYLNNNKFFFRSRDRRRRSRSRSYDKYKRKRSQHLSRSGRKSRSRSPYRPRVLDHRGSPPWRRSPPRSRIPGPERRDV